MSNIRLEDYEAEVQGTAGLDEVDAPAPDQNPGDSPIYRRRSLESQRPRSDRGRPDPHPNWRATLRVQAHITSYLVFFSILGVMARLGLIALTSYPGAPLSITAVWANTAGSFAMGFLREDRTLFRRHWRASSRAKTQVGAQGQVDEDDTHPSKTFVNARSTIHSFVGLTVGFCGTLTSFADIIRDFFFAITNTLDTTAVSTQRGSGISQPRNNGYAVAAGIAVLWVQIAMSISALKFGAHVATAAHPLADFLPSSGLQKVLDKLMLAVGYGTWTGAICFAIWTPVEAWRGQVLFAVVFAPAGAITRYHLSRTLNRKLPSFPLGTFVANVLGTCVLGMVLDLQQTRSGRVVVSCQVLQGIADGFCGGLTTVSTWVLELEGLAKRHAYVYATISVGVTALCMTVIAGPVTWTQGTGNPVC